ncbi:Uncharacterized protein SCF082_LOCUS43915 [Durusdinium trenchii]|uniref:FACT complex subunit n=1 Tax=Durusdinium trenchii TaxID=1381693 RepID=A0ABP0QYH5_9DINO
MSLADPVKMELEKALLDTSQGLLGKWRHVLDVLLSNKVAFKAKLPVTSLLVHPQNRGGSGLQPFGMHHKGAKIVQCGASLDQLIGSVCFEMHPSEEKRNKQIDFNQQLVASSNGLMSPILGGERYATVSSTHTSQFCKALLHGCKTPEESLQDSHGNLSLEMLGKDSVLKEMATDGWEWIVIPWYVEDAFPKLPATIADALNSVNGIFEAQGELELALTIANAAVGAEAFEWDELATSCCTSSQVAGYAKWIGKLEFQKQFGNSCFVGKEFFVSLLDLNLVPTSMTTFVKIAILATQVAAPENKRVDGFSRFLTKGDLQVLKNKKKQAQVTEAEDVLAKCWQKLLGTDLDQMEKNKAFGKACLRATLHLLKKEKLGRDSTEFKCLAEIGEAFDADLALAGKKVPTLSTKPAKKECAVSLQEGQNPMFMAGLKVALEKGEHYVHKDYPNMVFKLDNLDSNFAHLSSTDLVSKKTTSLKLDGIEIVEKLKKTKQKIGDLLGGSSLANAFPSVQCQGELTKCLIFQQLFSAYETHDTDENYIQCLVVQGKGTRVFAVQPIKKHDLVLVPMCENVGAIGFEEPKSKLFGSGKWDGKCFYTTPPKLAKDLKESTVVPYFLVKEIDDGQMAPFTLDLGKLKIVALRNSCAIDKHQEIGLVKAEAEPPAKKRKA